MIDTFYKTKPKDDDKLVQWDEILDELEEEDVDFWEEDEDDEPTFTEN